MEVIILPVAHRNHLVDRVVRSSFGANVLCHILVHPWEEQFSSSPGWSRPRAILTLIEDSFKTSNTSLFSDRSSTRSKSCRSDTHLAVVSSNPHTPTYSSSPLIAPRGRPAPIHEHGVRPASAAFYRRQPCSLLSLIGVGDGEHLGVIQRISFTSARSACQP